MSRVKSCSLLPVLVLLAAAPTASASVTTANACKWSADGRWRAHDVTLSAAAPQAVLAGGAATVTGLAASAKLPDFIVQDGYDTGLLERGTNTIPATVWLALNAPGGLPSPIRVVEAQATGTTTISVDSQANYVSNTPLEVSVQLPAAEWIAPAGGVLSFAQAGPGLLPKLPTGPADALRQPVGSLVIRASLKQTRITLDCKPGVPAADQLSAADSAAAPFASTLVTTPDAPDAPPATVSILPVAKLASTGTVRTNAARKTVKVSVRCEATATGACFGRVAAETATKYAIGKAKARKVTIGQGKFAVPAGSARDVELRLTSEAQALLKTRAGAIKLAVTVNPQSGTPATAPLGLRRR